MNSTIDLIQKLIIIGLIASYVNLKCSEGSDKYCAVCDNNNCILCYHSFPKNGECAIPNTTIENCLIYNDQEKCITCKPQYYLENEKCVLGEIDWCLKYNNKSECLECDGILLKEDKTCDFESICSMKGCLSCEMKDSKEVCNVCHDKYVKMVSSEGVASCESETQSTKGVQIQNSGKSYQCRYGYYISSKKEESLICTLTDLYTIESIMIMNMYCSVLLLLGYMIN